MKKKHGYWNNKQHCQKEALKYTQREDFKIGSNGAYQSAYKNKWLDEICSHIKSKKEIWSKENCQKEALKYKTRNDFYRNSCTAYYYARMNGWLDNICFHMVDGNIKWNKENCQKEALKYNKKYEFQCGSKGAYESARKNKWLDEICKHMIKKDGVKPSGYWTYEKCKEEALKYNTRPEFNKKAKGAYLRAYRNGWLDDVCSHMIKRIGIKTYGYWNRERCLKEALKYNTRIQFQKCCPVAYQKSRINGWLDSVCSHMKPKNKKWTYESCKEEVLKYKTRSDFSKNSFGAYNVARKNGWLDEFFPK